MFICCLKRSENSFFLSEPSSSPLPASPSSNLQRGTSASAQKGHSHLSDPPPPRLLEGVLPFEAVALPPPFVEASLEAEGPRGPRALRCGRGAEHGRPLQLGAHGFGVAAEVAGAGAVRRLVPEELGDGGVATAGGEPEGDAVKSTKATRHLFTRQHVAQSSVVLKDSSSVESVCALVW